jgi:hypothetical protein
MAKVIIEIHKRANAADWKQFEGRCLGYIDDQEFEIILENATVRKRLISSKSVTLKELNDADTNILDKRIVFMLNRTQFLITAPIKNKVCYTEKESTSIEFMSLESIEDDWISLEEK